MTETAAGHTPAPWHVGTLRLVTNGNIDIAQVIRTNGDEKTAQANARLIAAAPEMYTVLDDLVAFCVAQGWTGAGIDAAQAVLIKALPAPPQVTT